MVSTWCIRPRRRAVLSIIGEPSIVVYYIVRCLSIYLQQQLSDSDFFSERDVFNWAGTLRYCKLYPYYPFVSHLTSILRGHQLVPSEAFHGYPFIRRTTTRRATHVLKHPGYWCNPGVESRSCTGAWAGRCVIAHLDDCWGPFEGLGHRLTGRGTADDGAAAVGCFCV